MKKIVVYASYLLCWGSVCFAALHATEDRNREKMAVGERVATAEEIVAMQKEKQQLEELEQEELQLLARSTAVEHAGAYHQPYAIDTEFGSEIELVDGSVWVVHSKSRATVKQWSISDLLFISPNSSTQKNDSVFSYNFSLVNDTENTIANVELIKGPFYYGDNSYWIVNIDSYRNKVTLNDSSQWDISIWGRAELRRWLVNDTVLLGVNSGLSKLFNHSILINVATKDYVSCSRNRDLDK